MSYVDNKYYYEVDKPKERTKKRLEEIYELGLIEVGEAQFGLKGVMSGLYIERVWNLSDTDWKKYIDWIKYLIKEKSKHDANRNNTSPGNNSSV